MVTKISKTIVLGFLLMTFVPVFGDQPETKINRKVKKEIMGFLQEFQEGYTQRDPSKVQEWSKKLMTPDITVMGTHAVYPNTGEWQVGIDHAARLFANDWKRWGVLKTDIKNAQINMVTPKVAMVAMFATVTKSVENGYGRSNEDNMKRSIKRLAELEKNENKSTQLKLFTAVWDAAMVLKNVELGETIVWPIRISMVLVNKSGKWKMARTHFSHPMSGYPPVRLVGGKVVAY